MTETLGTAKLDIVVDTSQFDNAIAAAKSRVSGMSQTAQAEYEKLNAAEKRRVNSLITQADLIGKTREEQILYNAALKGAPTAVLDDLKRRLQGVNQVTKDGAISAKQYNAALRGVPAQLTDIFTGLSSGQSPFTVLIQQGGQLKDMFGGVGPAASALGNSLMGLINPATLAAAAIAGLGYAWNSAESEMESFSRALIFTGLQTSITSDQLRAMAEELDRSTVASGGKAAEVIAQVASTGRFTAEQIKLVSQAAIQMEDATGRAIEQTIADFVSLTGDPVDALLKLNESQNFLTDATLRQVQELMEQGRQADATAVAVRALADVTNERTPQAVASLSTLSSIWRDIKHGASEAFDEIVQGFRDTEGAAQASISSMATSLKSFNATLGFVGDAFGRYYDAKSRAGAASSPAGASGGAIYTLPGTGKPLPGVGAPLGPVNSAEATKALREEQEAARRFAAVELENLSKREKLEQRILQIKADGLKAGKDQATIEAQVTAERRKFAEAEERAAKKGRGARKRGESDPTESIVARIKQQIALNEAEASSEEKLTAAERLRVQVLQELERLGAKATPARRAEITALLDQAVASEKVVKAAEDERRAKEALLQLEGRLKAASASRAAGNRAVLAQFGAGDRELEQLRRQAEILREFEDGLAEVQQNRGKKTKEALDAEAAAWAKWRDDELAKEADFWRAIDAERANALNGVRRAMVNYVDEAGDIAGQTEAIFANAFSGMEDVLVEFFTKGKADWRGFLDSIAADITRFIVRQQLSKAISKFLPGFGGQGEGDQASALAGSAGQLAASGGVLLSAAAALSASAAALAAAGAANGGTGGAGGGGTGFLSWILDGYAKGGAFIGGAPVAFAAGGVVTGPTLFPMSSGRTGLMGEAGPEAIVPLKRGRDGKLGITMEQAPAAAPVTQVFHTHIQGRLDRRTEEQMHRETGRQAARGMARTGR